MDQTYYHFTQKRTISFGKAVKSFYANYFDFKSRSRRSEYWWAILYENIFLLFVLSIFALSPAIGVFLFFVALIALVIPDLAVTVRRLHDVGQSGWLVLLVLVPVIGSIILTGFCLKDSSKIENEWGVSLIYLKSETFDGDDSDNDLSAWSYIWPLLLGLAMVIFFYFAGFYLLISSFSSLGNNFDNNDFDYPDIFENDSTWMIDESDTSAIVTDSTDFEVLSDTTEDITSK